MVAVVLLLYVFLVGISLLETGIAGLGSGFTDGLLASVANPISGLFAGLLFTVLVQSSSVSTSAIVGLVGAGTLTVPLAVPMIMGANIGTTITNTFAALGQHPATRRSSSAGSRPPRCTTSSTCWRCSSCSPSSSRPACWRARPRR